LSLDAAVRYNVQIVGSYNIGEVVEHFTVYKCIPSIKKIPTI